MARPSIGNPDLIRLLEDRIAREGALPFSAFMDEVLYHPRFGYYSRAANPIGAAGDFYTAPMVDPVFGQLLTVLFSRMADRIDGFRLIELGAGGGLLARSILEEREFPYAIIERSTPMRERQREVLEDFDVEWLDELPPAIRGCVFSNEFFDALPVRRYVRRNGEIREIFVGPGLVPVELDPAPRVDLPRLEEGGVADISIAAADWVKRIGRSIDAGYHLAIDYGYDDAEFYSHTSGTLMCYRGHRADPDPFDAIGLKDLTAHVNFGSLVRAGSETGMETDGFVRQREFLAGAGLLDHIATLAGRGDAASVGRIQALKTLLLPPMMGDRFRVLLQRKGLTRIPLPGFGETVGQTGS